MTMNSRLLPLLTAALLSLLAGCQKDEFASGAVAGKGPKKAETTKVVEAPTWPVPSPKGDTNVPLADYKPMDDGKQLMAQYFSFTSVPDDVTSLAANYDAVYRKAGNDFDRRDRLPKYRAELVAAAEQAKSSRYVVVYLPETAWKRVGARSALGAYDFDKKAFQVGFLTVEKEPYRDGIHNGMYDPAENPSYKGNGMSVAGNSYSGLYFSNWRDFVYLPVPDEALARDLDGKKNKSVGNQGILQVRVYAFINAVIPDQRETNIQAQIMKLQLVDLSGKVLADK